MGRRSIGSAGSADGRGAIVAVVRVWWATDRERENAAFAGWGGCGRFVVLAVLSGDLSGFTCSRYNCCSCRGGRCVSFRGGAENLGVWVLADGGCCVVQS